VLLIGEGVQLERACNWRGRAIGEGMYGRGHAIGEGMQLERACIGEGMNWRGHAVGEGVQSERELSWGI